MDNGFSLRRIAIALFAVMFLLIAIFISLRFFMTRRSMLADRRNALLIASSHMSDTVPRNGDMQDGFSSEYEIAGDSEYLVETSLTTFADNIREIRISVLSPSGEIVELVRGLYGNN